MTTLSAPPIDRHRDPAAPSQRFPLWNPMTPMSGYWPADQVIARAEGVRVWDEGGRAYLDGVSGLWNVCCGYGHPQIVGAIKEQLDTLAYAPLFGGRSNRPAIELARRLIEVGPISDGRAFFTSSGSAAVDTAMKLALRVPRLLGEPEANQVIALEGSYHGTGYASMLATGESVDQDEYGVDVSWVHHVAHDDPEALGALAARLGRRLAAVVVEPVLGTGAYVLPPSTVAILNEICTAPSVSLVVDEVTTGFGRTGTLFASPTLGLRPDLVVLSKGITSGYLPLAATLCSGAICDLFDSRGAVFRHGETQSGNPVGCAAGLATLDVLEEPAFRAHAGVLAEAMDAELEELASEPSVAGHRGLGLLRAVELRGSDGRPLSDAQVAAVLAAVRAEGALVYASPSGIGLLPPLVMALDELAELVECVRRALWRVVL